MAMRPIILHGAEKCAVDSTGGEDKAVRFDGAIGIWRDADGHSIVAKTRGPGTTKTATREGIDQSEVSAMSTVLTYTREGLDESERAG